jgi:hypothetical protein
MTNSIVMADTLVNFRVMSPVLSDGADAALDIVAQTNTLRACD